MADDFEVPDDWYLKEDSLARRIYEGDLSPYGAKGNLIVSPIGYYGALVHAIYSNDFDRSQDGAGGNRRDDRTDNWRRFRKRTIKRGSLVEAKFNHKSSWLRLADLVDMYSAVAFANEYGVTFNAHITFTWSLMGIDDPIVAMREFNRFNKRFTVWCSRNERVFEGSAFRLDGSPVSYPIVGASKWLYCNEVSKKSGFHTHFLTSIPKRLISDFRAFLTSYVSSTPSSPGRRGRANDTADDRRARAAKRAAEWRERAAKTKAERQNKVDGAPAEKKGRAVFLTCHKPSLRTQWELFYYLCKGYHPTEEFYCSVTRKRRRLSHLIPHGSYEPGVVPGRRRWRCSENLSTDARAQRRFTSLLEKGVTDKSKLYYLEPRKDVEILKLNELDGFDRTEYLQKLFDRGGGTFSCDDRKTLWRQGNDLSELPGMPCDGCPEEGYCRGIADEAGYPLNRWDDDEDDAEQKARAEAMDLDAQAFAQDLARRRFDEFIEQSWDDYRREAEGQGIKPVVPVQPLDSENPFVPPRFDRPIPAPVHIRPAPAPPLPATVLTRAPTAPTATPRVIGPGAASERAVRAVPERRPGGPSPAAGIAMMQAQAQLAIASYDRTAALRREAERAAAAPRPVLFGASEPEAPTARPSTISLANSDEVTYTERWRRVEFAHPPRPTVPARSELQVAPTPRPQTPPVPPETVPRQTRVRRRPKPSGATTGLVKLDHRHTDLSAAEWQLVAPWIPAAKTGGRPRRVDIRAVLNGVLFVLESGSGWHALPPTLPPRATCHAYYDRWEKDGTLVRIYNHLYVERSAGTGQALRQGRRWKQLC